MIRQIKYVGDCCGCSRRNVYLLDFTDGLSAWVRCGRPPKVGKLAMVWNKAKVIENSDTYSSQTEISCPCSFYYSHTAKIME